MWRNIIKSKLFHCAGVLTLSLSLFACGAEGPEAPMADEGKGDFLGDYSTTERPKLIWTKEKAIVEVGNKYTVRPTVVVAKKGMALRIKTPDVRYVPGDKDTVF